MGAWSTARALVRSAVFVFSSTPSVLSRPVAWVTRGPVIERLSLDTPRGRVEAELYRPDAPAPHPGVVACFGVVPVEATDPRVKQIGEGLARSGFAALLYWSPTMRDLRLEPGDIAELTSAYEALLRQPSVDPARSGFMGVCVGGSFALMAAASPSIRERVTFISAYAPYSSMWTLAADIASGTRTLGDDREHWDVDPLTWKTYVRSVTGWLRPTDAQRLREAFEDRVTWNATKTAIIISAAGAVDETELSDDGRAIFRLLRAGRDDVQSALQRLPATAKELLDAMSPIRYVKDIAAPTIVLLHDRDDHVIPVGESRRLWSALAPTHPGARYTEMHLNHLRVPKGWSPLQFARELFRSYRAVYPLFRETTA